MPPLGKTEGQELGIFQNADFLSAQFCSRTSDVRAILAFPMDMSRHRSSLERKRTLAASPGRYWLGQRLRLRPKRVDCDGEEDDWLHGAALCVQSSSGQGMRGPPGNAARGCAHLRPGR